MAEFDLSPSAAGQVQMLSLAELGENWAVYLNGQEIHKEIFLNTSGEIIRRRSLQKALISSAAFRFARRPQYPGLSHAGQRPTQPLSSRHAARLSKRFRVFD